jgi:hypothetical protein
MPKPRTKASALDKAAGDLTPDRSRAFRRHSYKLAAKMVSASAAHGRATSALPTSLVSLDVLREAVTYDAVRSAGEQAGEPRPLVGGGGESDAMSGMYACLRAAEKSRAKLHAARAEYQGSHDAPPIGDAAGSHHWNADGAGDLRQQSK